MFVLGASEVVEEEEEDQFDAHSRHALLRVPERKDKTSLGGVCTCRLVAMVRALCWTTTFGSSACMDCDYSKTSHAVKHAASQSSVGD